MTEDEKAKAEWKAIIDANWTMGNFYGPCTHGRDPYTRCDEGCGDLTPKEAYTRTVTAEVERLREALRVALNAMNSMGDELNALDVAGEMPDYDDNCHAFEVVRAALAGKDKP